MRLRKRADCKRDIQAQFTVTKAMHRHRSRGAALVGNHDPANLRSEVLNRMEGYFKKADGGTIIIKNVQLLNFEKQSVLYISRENIHQLVHSHCLEKQIAAVQ